LVPNPALQYFLEEIVLFVGAAGRAEEAEAVTAVLGLDLLQTRRGKIKGLVPRDLFQGPILADKRSGQAVCTVDEFVSIPSFDAELAPIHGSSLQRQRSDQTAVHHFEKHLTAAPAIRTGGCDAMIIHGRCNTPCQSSEL